VLRLLYISGAGAAADGERHWFRAKWRAEEAVRGSELAYTIIRPTWIHGPRDVALNRFLGFARTLPFVPLSNFGGQRLAPVFVGDVARLAADALVSDAACNQVFEIGGPETMTMREVIRRALRVAGLRRPLIPAPAPLVKLAAAFLQYLPGRPLTPDGVDFVNQPAEVDLAPLLERMPRRLTPLEEALATYLVPRHS
jgi:NADH dehydrogenase